MAERPTYGALFRQGASVVVVGGGVVVVVVVVGVGGGGVVVVGDVEGIAKRTC